MGNLVSTNEEQIHDLVKGQYQILDYPSLMHRPTKQHATIYKVTAKTEFESKKIQEIIQQYKHSKCQSILHLRSNYFINRSGYCSDQQNYYLVFDGKNDYTLHEQYLQRRLQGKPFKQTEIIQIIETYLSGLRQYDHRFQAEYENLLLSSITIDQQSLKMYLKDPSISRNISNYDYNDNRTKLLTSYPSPEKINTNYNSAVEDYNVFLSNLFSIGIIALQLNNLQFIDDIYIKKKEVDYLKIKQKINQLKDTRLRRGIECLVDFNPVERKRIYQIWGIQNKEEHFLQSLVHRSNNNLKVFSSQPSVVINAPSNQYQRSYSQSKPLPQRPVANPAYRPYNQNLLIQNIQAPSYNNSVKFTPPSSTDRSINSQNLHLSYKEYDKVSNQSNGFGFNTKSINMPSQRSKYSFKDNNEGTSQSIKLPEKPFLFQDFMKKQQKKPQITQSNEPSSFKFNTYNFSSQPISSAPSLTSTQPKTNLDFLSKYDSYNPTPTTTLIGSTQPISSKYDSYSPQTTLTGPPKPLQFKSFQTSIQSMNTTSTSPALTNGHINGNLAPFKESITYYDNRNSNGQNMQTYLDSLKERNVKSILIEEKKDYLPTFYNKKDQYIQPITLTQKQNALSADNKVQTSLNQLSKTYENAQSPIIIKNEETKLQENNAEQSIPASLTPRKPTGKNKFNSTIVEVKDEDSPEHSQRSEEGVLEEQYVVEEYETGSRYEGFKSANMRNGRGKFYYQDGGYYQGQWKSNKMDGYGKLYYEGGKLAYEGSWYQDQFNGEGKVYNDNPVFLSGPFDYTNFDQLEDYWEYYEGTLARDTKEGRGKIKLSNGELFQGDFHNDRIQGFGKFYTIENRVIEGIWRQSRLIKIIKSD